LPWEWQGTEFGSQIEKITPRRAYLIAHIRSFVSIEYLLWASDSVSKADLPGPIMARLMVSY